MRAPNRTDFGRVALLAMARTVREHDALAGLRDMVGSVVDEWRNTGPDDPRPALIALVTAVAPGVGAARAAGVTENLTVDAHAAVMAAVMMERHHG